MAASWQLIDADSESVIIPRLELATSFWQRFRGLQLRAELPEDQGLLIKPCRSIHTHWMRFSIDVAMLDEDGLVLEVFSGVKPWRFVRQVRRTRSVLETSAGALEGQLQAGMHTRVVSKAEGDLPPPTQPLENE